MPFETCAADQNQVNWRRTVTVQHPQLLQHCQTIQIHLVSIVKMSAHNSGSKVR